MLDHPGRYVNFCVGEIRRFVRALSGSYLVTNYPCRLYYVSIASNSQYQHRSHDVGVDVISCEGRVSSYIVSDDHPTSCVLQCRFPCAIRKLKLLPRSQLSPGQCLVCGPRATKLLSHRPVTGLLWICYAFEKRRTIDTPKSSHLSRF